MRVKRNENGWNPQNREIFDPNPATKTRESDSGAQNTQKNAQGNCPSEFKKLARTLSQTPREQ
jgi:hypothetical protein